MMKEIILQASKTLLATILFIQIGFDLSAQSIIEPVNIYISNTYEKGSFNLALAGKSAPLYVSSQDFLGVIKAAKNLQTDIEQVTSIKPEFLSDKIPHSKEIVLIGTLGKSPWIDELVKKNKLDISALKNRWETFVIQTIEKPFKGIEKALVIVGSDKRGTIFGIYDLSAQIGVSPWHWWADVPIQKQSNLFVKAGKYSLGEPKVKYRGIFINDEEPALGGWVRKTFGGFNHKFYDKVFELILRMKGNYLWPAMWGKSIYDDDSLSPKLADELGVVLGTSHHEPLSRAHVEWNRYGKGKWNYANNEAVLKEFWQKGIQRMGKNENIVTIGMRGDGDEPMSEGTAITLLEKIVQDQRQIIADITQKKPEETPQMWALYKEVQDYYDKGMRVPDDVTLLLCDDNWGNIRKLPKLDEKPRKGGYGIYYHFDYVGGPRNYKWLNTNPIPRIWEQMHLAYEHQARQLWVVNVGDIKPMEFPIQFFLDYAWNPEKWKPEVLHKYTELWVKQQFGNQFTVEIADILAKYTKFNARRKPELLSSETYSLIHYQEAERVVTEYNALAEKAEKIYQKLPKEYQDAYYQLILFPTKACANLNELYVMVAKNRWYAKQGRAITNQFAEKAQKLYAQDSLLTLYFHKTLANGKWEHQMAQTHIGYTYWQQPNKNSMPKVEKIELPNQAEMAISLEGSDNFWTKDSKEEAILPEFSVFQKEKHYLEIFNRGKTPFNYTIENKYNYLIINQLKNKIETQERIWLDIDWQKAPAGETQIPLIIKDEKGNSITVKILIKNPVSLKLSEIKGFIESNGYISIEAEHFSKVIDNQSIKWQVIPDLGRTLSGITVFPVTASSQNPVANSPRLEYEIYLTDTSEIKVQTYFSPTLNFHNNQGLRYGISIDDEPIQIIAINAAKETKEGNVEWEKWVANNIIEKISTHKIKQAGNHTLKFWYVDSGVVLQKILIDTGNLKPTYLGAPESFYQGKK